jgi:hypothetical protein
MVNYLIISIQFFAFNAKQFLVGKLVKLGINVSRLAKIKDRMVTFSLNLPLTSGFEEKFISN